MATGKPDEKWVPTPVTAAAGQSSTPIMIPGYIKSITVTAIPGGGGSATIQHTTADPALVEANPGAQQWVDWDAGSVNVATSRSSSGAVSAVRINAVAQTATLQVCGDRG